MKIYFFLFIFVLLFQSMSLKLEDDTQIIYLREEEKKKPHTILLNETYKIINFNEKYIYFLELEDGLEVQDEKNQTFKKFVLLSSRDNYFIINPTEDTGKEINFYVTSILNDEIKGDMFKNPNFHITTTMNENFIILIHVDEADDRIINLDSFEKSLLFSYCKYENLNGDPSNIYPVNRTLFTRYDGSILTLDKNSVYIFVAEIYKLDSIINTIDIFSSPVQADKEIKLQSDMLYLKESDDIYNIKFEDTNLTRIFKLSKKSSDSIVIIDEDEEHSLNINNSYYELTKDQMTNGINLKVKKTDCLIEVLFSSEIDSEILDSYSKEDYKLTKKYTIIKIPKNKCTYDFFLSSKNKNNLTELDFGYNHKISKNGYFYSWLTLSANYHGENGINLKLTAPYLYRTEIDEEEYQIFEIILDKEQLDNDIYLTYNPSYYFKYLQQEIDENTSDYIIKNISSLLQKFYIYKDIAKIPPKINNLENYHHKPIDLLEDINNINRKNQTHFSLYQDIFKVLNSVRDGHLGIRLNKIGNIFDLESAEYCSPFDLYIGNISNIPVVKIRAYEECLNVAENKDSILKFIEAHADIPLRSINGTNPFTFIQDFGKLQVFRNRHAQFTNNLESVKHSSIRGIPYDLSDLADVEYEFENGDIINMNYLLVTSENLQGIDKKEFQDFYHSIIYNQSNQFLIPNLFQTKKIFLKQKGLLFDETPDKIQWDTQTQDGLLKCKVDDEHKYNVFLQTGFNFKSMDDAINVMVKCSDLFYSNNYKIIGIENMNGGGTAMLYEVWHQLIQQKTLDKTYRSIIKNDDAFQYLKEFNYYQGLSNIETCKYYGSIEDMGQITDDYGKSEIFDQNITHNRSNIYDFLDKTWRKRLEAIRENNFKANNLKNSTDILIYTDAFCFSACSGFVKAFQNTGGAIVVGFNGNPTIGGTEEFDGSQSSSSVAAFQTEEYYALENLGYHVTGITYSESYDDSYQDKDKAPIPREYTVDLVDRRVPIYQSYSDDIYDSFISNADNIFKEFETKCSKNNEKLLLDDETCQLKEHEKGGHVCGEDGNWDMNKCGAYYCDLGYYYDQFQHKCILDICTHIENESNIYINDSTYNETKEFEVNPNSELVFHLQNDSYYYFIESNVENIISTYTDNQGLINSTSLTIVEYEHTNVFDYEVNINYFRNLKEPAKIKLTALEKNPKILIRENIYTDSVSGSLNFNIPGDYQLIYNFQTKQKNIVLVSSFNRDIKAYYAEYNFDITPQEIINIEPKKFKEFTNELFTTKEEKDFIFIMKFPKDIISNALLFLKPHKVSQNIVISNDRFVYLSQQNFDYNLVFDSDSKTIYIKLCSQTPDAEIEILENNAILNKNNKYFLIQNNIKTLSLKLKNNNSALIEVLYELRDVTNLDINKKELNLTSGNNYILKYKKSDKIKSINVYLETNNSISGIIYANYGKGNHLAGTPPKISLNSNFYITDYLVPNDNLADDETFNILINLNNNATLKVELNKKDDPKKDEGGEGLPTWALIVIIVVGILVLIVLIIIIIKCTRKNHISADNIEKANLLSSYNTE